METFTLGTAIGLNTTHNASLYASVNSSCAQTTPPPPGYCGAFSCLVSPRVGHLQILCCPGARHLPTPGPIPRYRHASGFLSEYNYTQRISLGEKEDWLVCQGQEKIEEGCKGMFLILCMHFFIAYQARITGRNRELPT